MRDMEGFLYVEFKATRPGWMRPPLRISVPNQPEEGRFHIVYAPYLVVGRIYTAILDTTRDEARIRLGTQPEVLAWMKRRAQS